MKRIIPRIGLHLLYLVIAIIVITPLWWAVVSSLRPNAQIFAYTSPFDIRAMLPGLSSSIDAYVALFTERGFGTSVSNTVFVAAATIVGSLVVNGLAGFVFAKYEFPFKRIIFGAVLLTFMIPFEAIALPLYGVVKDLGFLNTYWALILPAVPNGVMVFMFRQFFLSVPHELFEAAQVDGAGAFRSLWNVYIPLSKATLITGSLLVFLDQWQSFMWPLLAIQSDSMKVIQVAIADLSTEDVTLWNEVFAASIVSVAIPILLLIPLQRHYTSSFMTSGSKG